MIYIINILFEFIKIILIIRIGLSWFPHNRYNPIINIIYQISEPMLKPFRNLINPVGGIDFSPIIIFFILSYLQRVVINLLISI